MLLAFRWRAGLPTQLWCYGKRRWQRGFGLSISILGSVCTPVLAGPLVAAECATAVTDCSGFAEPKGVVGSRNTNCPCAIYTTAVGTCSAPSCSDKHLHISAPQMWQGNVTPRAVAQELLQPWPWQLWTLNPGGSRHPQMAESPGSFSFIVRFGGPAPPGSFYHE